VNGPLTKEQKKFDSFFAPVLLKYYKAIEVSVGGSAFSKKVIGKYGNRYNVLN
jgi:hypothetical protein